MVIADAESPGPAKKRPRLSLKVHKGAESNKQEKEDPKAEGSDDNAAESDDICSENVQELCIEESTSDTSTAVTVPAVASLENLGNTCFLNSVLQVLRFSPGFLQGLELLYQEIIQVEKLKRQEILENEDGGIYERLEKNKVIQLVKDLYRLYKNLERREEKHEELASADVMSMAVKPQRLLNIIRELNPIFEGYLQHDAQELLRCVLSCLQDSHKDLSKLKSLLANKLQPKEKPKNRIMEQFIIRGMKSKSENVFHRPDILDQIELCEAAKTVTQMNNSINSKSDCEKSSPISETKSCPKAPKRTPRNKTQETNSGNKSRKGRQTPKAANSEKDVDETDGNTVSEKKINGHCDVTELKQEKGGRQQTILGMFQNQKTCKRLGMSRTVLRGASNKTEEKNLSQNSTDSVTNCENKSNNCNVNTENAVKCRPFTCVESSPVNNSPLKSQQVSPKRPVVKLEKCDRVCDSPLKSVSAEFASQTLTSKNVCSNTSQAKVKLDFSMKPQSVLGDNLLTVSKTNFIEQLFMGKMMLRTKCCECENCRERVEDFHDISVPVRSEKAEDSDDEMEKETENDSCLRKLMFAFTAVERLRDENKYFCDTCLSHVEAERSLHYQVLPDILTLHLKRFSTLSGIFGYASKINDHVSIPLALPCLRYKCPSPCVRPDHRYLLYAIITHAGMTLTSGHYLSYVHVPVQQNSTQSVTANMFNNFLSTPMEKYSGQWLECDDETVRVCEEEKFQGMLQGDGSLLGTPYVLFYHRNM